MMLAAGTPGAVTYPDVTVQLSGRDGNAFAIIGAVQNAIAKVHGSEAAREYAQEAMESPSYDALLQHAMRTVVVQ